MTLRTAGRLRLPVRLMLAQMGVIVIALLLASAVTAWYGPGVFRRRFEQGGAPLPATVVHRAEQAFHVANLLDIALAVIIALGIALGLSVVLAGLITRTTVALADAAQQIAAGRYASRVPLSNLSPELDAMADAFNRMAAQLQSVEATRRRLLADLAHELRTPIATLDGYLEGIQDGVITPDEPTLSMLRTQSARLSRLTEDIAAVSAAEEHQLRLRREQVRPDELVGDAVAAARALAARRYPDKGLTVVALPDPALPMLYVDRQRLEQALGNLLNNALRHSQPGGTVTVTAHAEPNRTVALAVHDAGDGIAVEHVPHLFERFYRTDRARDRDSGGSGIGLTIADAIVKAHDGRLTGESAGPGQGSTFTIRLHSA